MLGKKNKQSSKLGTKKSETPQMGIKSNDLQNILAKSYDKTPSDYGDYKVDKSLSGQRAQVYTNDATGKVIVAHRGTAGMHDMITDVQFGLGKTDNKRFELAIKTSNDPFSLNNNRENSRKIVIDNGFSLNPFSNHSTDNIEKLKNEFL